MKEDERKKCEKAKIEESKREREETINRRSGAERDDQSSSAVPLHVKIEGAAMRSGKGRYLIVQVPRKPLDTRTYALRVFHGSFFFASPSAFLFFLHACVISHPTIKRQLSRAWSESIFSWGLASAINTSNVALQSQEI